MNLLIAPFVNALFGLYYLLGNFGWAIVVVTVLIRLALMPLVVPSLKSAEKMRELQPKLKKIQEKFKGEKEKLAAAQMELYKQEGVNPLSGCLPQLAQIAVLIIFFSAFNLVTKFSEGKGSFEEINKQLIPSFQINKEFKIDPYFIGTDLRESPSKVIGKGIGWGAVLPLIMLLGSGWLQYLSAKMMMPAYAKASAGKPSFGDGSKGKSVMKVDDTAYVKETPGKEDDMMSAMRTQSLYMMPLMTIFIGWSFSIGLLLYWFINSAVMVGQQLIVNKLKPAKTSG